VDASVRLETFAVRDADGFIKPNPAGYFLVVDGQSAASFSWADNNPQSDQTIEQARARSAAYLTA
jgi:phage I-like protein